MSPRPLVVLLAVLTAVTAWAYWPPLEAAADRWATDPQYSHGYLIPLFSGYLLWSRRKMLGAAADRPAWWGLGLVAAGVGLRWAGSYYYLTGLDLVSLLPTLAGMVALVGGRSALRWAWPAVLFLVFMVPLPFRVQTALSGQLQRVATAASTYILQTVGAPAVAEGNVIVIDEVRIGVVEACSGLGMVVTFAALSAAVAMLVRAPVYVRAALLAGALPVAVAANVVRITATGLLYEADQAEAARATYHDLAGWLMMPLGVGLILAELSVLTRLVTDRRPPAREEQGPASPLLLPGHPASRSRSR